MRSALVVDALRRLADDLEKRPQRARDDYRPGTVFAAVVAGGTPEAELDDTDLSYLARLGVSPALYADAER